MVEIIVLKLYIVYYTSEKLYIVYYTSEKSYKGIKVVLFSI